MKTKNKVTILSDQPILLSMDKPIGKKIILSREPLIYCDKDKIARDLYAAMNKATAQPENKEVRITNEINTHLQEIERLFKELNSDHTFMISVESAKATFNQQSDLVVLVSFEKHLNLKK